LSTLLLKTFKLTALTVSSVSSFQAANTPFGKKIASDVGGTALHFLFEFVTSQMWIVSQPEQSLQGTVFCDVKNFKWPNEIAALSSLFKW
jgi:hypothetical protein